ARRRTGHLLGRRPGPTDRLPAPPLLPPARAGGHRYRRLHGPGPTQGAGTDADPTSTPRSRLRPLDRRRHLRRLGPNRPRPRGRRAAPLAAANTPARVRLPAGLGRPLDEPALATGDPAAGP